MRLQMLTYIVSVILLQSVTSLAADPLEGRWQVNGGGALVEFVLRPGTDGSLSMRWIDGPDLSIAEGTEIAIVRPSHKSGVYDCHASTDPRDGKQPKTHTVDFVIRFDSGDPDAIGFEAYSRSRRISLWRWLPYLFRITVINKDNRPNNLEGARRCSAPPAYITL